MFRRRKWQKELAQIEQRRNDFLPEHEKMQKLSQQLKSFGRQGGAKTETSAHACHEK